MAALTSLAMSMPHRRFPHSWFTLPFPDPKSYTLTLTGVRQAQVP